MLREKLEALLEGVLFASRWLLAPFYLGLVIGIGIVLIKFVQELYHIAEKAFTATEADVIVGVLSLVDLALTGSLLLIVIFSGYENFVSKIDHSGHRDWPEWMGPSISRPSKSSCLVRSWRSLRSSCSSSSWN